MSEPDIHEQEPYIHKQRLEELDYQYDSETQSKLNKSKTTHQRKKHRANIRGCPFEHKQNNSSLDQIMKEVKNLRKYIEKEHIEIKQSLQRLEEKHIEMIVSINDNTYKINVMQTQIEVNEKRNQDWMTKN